MRRAYLEIICVQILNGDKRLEETLIKFNEDAGGGAYSSDEYQMAS
jgi:hypothetical protein